MAPIVILGTGLAGYTVARELRRRDKAAPMALVTADGGEYYSKPALSNALANGQSPGQLVLNTAEQMARALKAEVLAGKAVTGVDRAAHRVEWVGGGIEYSRLVLAVGARCNRPRFAGGAADEVLTVNCLDDYRRFRGRLETARSVAIVGAGLVGCEFANDLAAAGFAVHVIEKAAHALAGLLEAGRAHTLAERLRGVGVGFAFGARVLAIERTARGYRVDLDGGEAAEADVILGATGLLPNVALARDAGLATRVGISVDGYLRTSDPDIYAIGDCAEVEGRILPFTEPIRHGARALAATLAGSATPVDYPPMRVELKTPAFPLAIETVAGACAG
jgi:rubredoxin-NAD+ reductase